MVAANGLQPIVRLHERNAEASSYLPLLQGQTVLLWQIGQETFSLQQVDAGRDAAGLRDLRHVHRQEEASCEAKSRDFEAVAHALRMAC